jgi:CheY-like chemotaxis protein
MLGQTLRFAFEDRFEVVLQSNGPEALQLLSKDPRFDIILCDLMMPTFSGIKVYEALAERQPELLNRFVFITGGAFTDSARDFLDAYGGPRLEKPFLVADVEALLDR